MRKTVKITFRSHKHPQRTATIVAALDDPAGYYSFTGAQLRAAEKRAGVSGEDYLEPIDPLWRMEMVSAADQLWLAWKIGA